MVGLREEIRTKKHLHMLRADCVKQEPFRFQRMSEGRGQKRVWKTQDNG